MCTSPKRILNKTQRYYSSTREYIYVPCGKCDECRQNKADDLHQRIYAEMRACTHAGGKVIFATYTYNPEHLPYFTYHDDSKDKDISFPCFSKYHYEKYMHSLRQFLNRRVKDELGILDKDYKYHTKVMWMPEYGMDQSRTRRSHYHALFFFSPEYFQVFGTYENTWKNILRKHWIDNVTGESLGYVRFSPKYSIFVNSEFAGVYVSKYACKDLDFYGREDVREYVKDMKRSVKDEKYMAIRDYLPTPRWSKHFGESLVEIYKDKNNFVNGYNFRFMTELKKAKPVYHSCPLYIERKICFDTRYDGTYVLNATGRDFRFARFKKMYDSIVDKYEDIISSGLDKISDLDVMNGSFGYCRNKQELKDLLNYIVEEHNTDSRSFAEKCILYNMIWSGKYIDPKDRDFFESLSLDELYDVSVEEYYDSLIPSFLENINENGVFSDWSPLQDGKIPIEHLVLFTGCDQYSRLIQEINNIYVRRSRFLYEVDRVHRKENKFLLKTG